MADLVLISKILYRAPQTGFLHELGRLAGSNPHSAPLLLLRPAVLLARYLERKDLDLAYNLLVLPLPALPEATDFRFADVSPHASFLVRFDDRGLLRRSASDWPSLGYRPAALLSGRDQQNLKVIIAHPKREGCKLFKLHRLIPPKPLEQTALGMVPGRSISVLARRSEAIAEIGLNLLEKQKL